ncbi:hypothetical protein HJFPF1_02799 [Paramyrothecium foliicola]|nr:hypothetical protein HJFPF1_02799 [Paramyrothecium foliicola]
MASSKEMQPSVRPLTQHRPSLSSVSSSGLPGRQSHSRNNSHSLLTAGALNASHRVTRRKSVTNPGANVAAITAALRDGERSPTMPIATAARRNTMSKTAAARAAIVSSLPSPPASLPSHAHKAMADMKREQDSAIDDDANDLSGEEGSNDKSQNARTRRASDGQPLMKEGRKSNRIEVRCDKWEHTPEWSFTSKLLISKHQQVQLLEAASVLVAMNGTSTDSSATPPDSAKDFPSEPESASPAASGYSDQAERQSSADTTPPPMSEGLSFGGYRTKRYSSGSGISRSYQSAPSSGLLAADLGSYGSGLGHFRQRSVEHRPSSSGLNETGQEDQDLAAAVELLSCSFGSNNGSRGTVTLPADAPPVPPVPAQYRDQAASLGTSFLNSLPGRQPESFTRGEMRRDSEDVKMEEGAGSPMDDDDFDMRSRARSDEDDDGVFGRMED